jgi:hypothetical protein
VNHRRHVCRPNREGAELIAAQKEALYYEQAAIA